MKNKSWIFSLIVLAIGSTIPIAGANFAHTSSTVGESESSTDAPSTDGTTAEVSHRATSTFKADNVSNNTTVAGSSTTNAPGTEENPFSSSSGTSLSTDSGAIVGDNLLTNTTVTESSLSAATTKENSYSSSSRTDHSTDNVTIAGDNLATNTTVTESSTSTASTEENTLSSTTSFDHVRTRPTKSIVEYDIDEYFYYNDLPVDNSFTQSSINDAMNADEVISYIANLKNDIQKYMVTENLRRCPLSAICHVSLSDVYLNYNFNTECCWACSCEPECVRNGDCCPDAPWLFQPSRENRTLPIGVKKTCLPRGIPERGDPLNNRIERIKGVVGCPEGVDDDLSSKCNQNYLLNKDNLSLYDVTFASNDLSGTIYRNIYCALCNGENAKNLTLWQPELSCGALSETTFFSTQEIVPRILSGKAYCDVVFAIPETLDPFIESCSSYVSRCNETGMWDTYNATIEAACELYGHIIEIEVGGETEGTLFRNPICAICNGFSPDRVGCFYSTNYNERYTFSGLLRLQDKSSTQGDDTPDCPPGTQYDKIKEKCREVHCAVGREFVGQKCLTITHIRKFMEYIVTVRVRPLTEMSSSSAYEIASDLGTKLYEMITLVYVPASSCDPDVLMYVSSCKTQSYNRTLELNSTYFKFYDVRFQLNYRYKHNSTQHISYFLSLDNKQIGLKNESIVILDDKEIELGKADPAFKINIISTNNTRFEFVLAVSNEISDSSRFETDRYTIVDEDNDFCVVPALATGICLNTGGYDIVDLRPCPMFNISLDEFKFERSIDGLYLASHNITFAVSEYSIHEDTNFTHISVCIDLYNDRFLSILDIVVRNVGLVEMVISVVLVVISIICLLFSLLTYCLFKHLQTLPGKNNMALITWLLLAQSLYLIGSFGGFQSGTVSCKLIGIVTHFSWLAALFWMHICTFHMFRVLSKMRAMNLSTGNSKYILYHTYTIVMSTVFVLINITVSMVTSGRTDMGYATWACYISSQIMIVWTFGFPTAFIVISNISLFCLIVIKLKRAPDVDKNVKHERNYILVFAKLSTITGAALGFGLAYMWTGSVVLSYLFTIFNASQGLFVMLGFVCNKRTLNLYTEVSAKFRTSIREKSNRTESSSL